MLTLVLKLRELANSQEKKIENRKVSLMWVTFVLSGAEVTSLVYNESNFN